MATAYNTSVYSDAPVSLPLGLIRVPVKYTVVTAVAQSTGDYIQLARAPKGVEIVPELCSVYVAADPDSANNLTVSLKITDGTTTKTIISTSNLQAANTRLVASAADIAGLGLFKTSSDDFVFRLTPEAGDIDAAAVVYVILAYTADASRDCAIT